MKRVQTGGERTVVFEEHLYAASPYGALIVSSKERAIFALAGREVVQRAKSIEVFIRHMQFLSAPALPHIITHGQKKSKSDQKGEKGVWHAYCWVH